MFLYVLYHCLLSSFCYIVQFFTNFAICLGWYVFIRLMFGSEFVLQLLTAVFCLSLTGCLLRCVDDHRCRLMFWVVFPLSCVGWAVLWTYWMCSLRSSNPLLSSFRKLPIWLGCWSVSIYGYFGVVVGRRLWVNGGAVYWGIGLQIWKSRVWFPTETKGFFTDLIISVESDLNRNKC
jgi:hypothetical protein